MTAPAEAAVRRELAILADVARALAEAYGHATHLSDADLTGIQYDIESVEDDIVEREKALREREAKLLGREVGA